MLHLLTVSAILLTAANVAAQSTVTVSVLFPGNEADVSGIASVIGSNPTGTTFLVGCLERITGTATCPSAPSESTTVTAGPSSLDRLGPGPEDTAAGTYRYSVHCDFTGTTLGICTRTAWNHGTTTTSTNTFYEVTYATLLVTAGAQMSPSATAGETNASTTAGGAPSGTAINSATKTSATSSPKSAGAHMCPSKGGIVAAFLLWGLFSSSLFSHY
jgi:hypothetical protein